MQPQVPAPVLLSTAFGRDEIAVLRHLVLVLAADAGVADARREELGLAVHELTTNVVRHGGGAGHLDLWVVDGRMWFRVSDHGPGMDAVVPDRAPEPTDPGGRGLWIAGHVLDQIDITSGEQGTTVVGSVATSASARGTERTALADPTPPAGGAAIAGGGVGEADAARTAEALASTDSAATGTDTW